MKLEEGVDYYWENGRMVFTELYHLRRGRCCGSGCKHCAYDPPNVKGNTKIEEKIKIDIDFILLILYISIVIKKTITIYKDKHLWQLVQ